MFIHAVAEAAMALKHVVFFLFSLVFFALTIDANKYTTGTSAGKSNITIGVQGMIYCNTGSSTHVPLEGAVARVSCLIVDENGYESALTFFSEETDEKGYFLAKLTPSRRHEIDYKGILTGCKAFLSSSPVKTCDVPTDINKGMSGAPLLLPRVLHNGMHLYSVKPFAYCNHDVPQGCLKFSD